RPAVDRDDHIERLDRRLPDDDEERSLDAPSLHLEDEIVLLEPSTRVADPQAPGPGRDRDRRVGDRDRHKPAFAVRADLRLLLVPKEMDGRVRGRRVERDDARSRELVTVPAEAIVLRHEGL